MSTIPQAAAGGVRPAAGGSNVYRAIGIWVIVLITIGFGQRWLQRSLEVGEAIPIALDHPLSTLPMLVGSWRGEDIPLDARVEARAANDDYVNRRYVDAAANRMVDFFLAYTSSPVTMLGHRPDTCYPAVGWRPIETKQVSVLRSDGEPFEVLVHTFSRGDRDSEGLVVLNYYVLQGRYTTEWTDFWGPRWRAPNRDGKGRSYVAQVQIVSPVMLAAMFDRGEETVKEFARVVAQEVERLLPLTPSSVQGTPVDAQAATLNDVP